MVRIAFAWPGLPDYAARCIRTVINHGAFPVDVIATRPSVPIEGMERSLGQPVHWIDAADQSASWECIGAPVPDVLFCGGYATAPFNALASQVRSAGGRVVLMSDNNWQGGWRHNVVDPVRHQLMHRRQFDSIFVPGASGARLARRWGYAPSETAMGLYGADPALFNGGLALSERPKTFLFVGQFIDRKNVVGLAEAFVDIADQIPGWTLSLCGSGPQADQIPKHPRLSVHGFVQPPQLAEMLRNVRCLVLPSRKEHWGLVVHEAALSGCALALSDTVGAADDLARAENAVLFRPGDNAAMSRALAEIAAWDAARCVQAESTSRRLAAGFGPGPFAASVTALVEQLLAGKAA